MRRRRLLAAIGAGSVGGLAGCAGTGPTDGDGDTGDSEDGGDAEDSEDGGDSGDSEDGGPDDGSDGDGGDDASGDAEGIDWPSGAYADYDATTVAVRTADGDTLGTVTAAVADTGDKRYTGLSDAETLPEDAGMLFVFPSPRDDLTFVMREMDFGIDIVYADADGRIVEVHNAPAPGPNEDGNDQRYPGSGRYVLEVPYEWTDRNGVAVGDVLSFDV